MMRTEPLIELAALRGLARSVAGTAPDADDLLQDAALALLEHPPSIDRSVRAWLARVIVNRWRMDRRALLRRRAREQAFATPPRELAELARLEDVDRMLAILPEPYRRLVIARYFEGKTSVELARELGIPAITVRTRLARALACLRRRTEP